jgi:hypothetical protein
MPTIKRICDVEYQYNFCLPHESIYEKVILLDALQLS